MADDPEQLLANNREWATRVERETSIGLAWSPSRSAVLVD